MSSCHCDHHQLDKQGVPWVFCSWVWMGLLQSSPLEKLLTESCFSNERSILVFPSWYYCHSSLVTSKCELLHFKKLHSSLWAPSSTRLRGICSGIRVILSELKTQGYSAWCYQKVRRNYVTPQQSYILPSGQGTDIPNIPLQPSLPKQNPWSLSLVAARTSSEWALNDVSHNLLLTFAWVVPHGETHSRSHNAIPRHGCHRKVLMGESSIVNPRREKETERTGIPACSLKSPLLAGFHASFQVF